MTTGMTVVICCHNSVLRIAPTLKHLANQKNLPLSSWEVIIVDNASTDNTSEFSTQVWNDIKGEKPVFKIVQENTPGLSSARKKGIEESNYDYVLFCDDDNWLDENYLSIALNIMQANPLIGALGGTGYPVFEDKEPPCFWINQYHTLAVGEQSAIDGDITNTRGVLYGAGMIINKTAFNTLKQKFSFQFQVTDRIGKSLASSGDHELCLALKKIGYKIYYSKSLKFQHFIPKQRTTIKYYKRLYLGFGISNALLHVYRINDKTIYNVKNDYRYICLRAFVKIIIIDIKLLLHGYYFDTNKYKYLDQIQGLYTHKGVLSTFLKVKNAFKFQYLNLPLFATKSL